VVYLLMALTVARMLRAQPQALPTWWWLGGSVCVGVALLLVAARNHVPAVIGFELVGLLCLAGALRQTAALRLLLGWQAWPRSTWIAVAVALAACVALALAGERRGLFAWATLVLAAAIGRMGWHAGLTARSQRSGSAVLLAWSQALLAGVLLARAVSAAMGVAPFRHGQGGVTFVAACRPGAGCAVWQPGLHGLDAGHRPPRRTAGA